MTVFDVGRRVAFQAIELGLRNALTGVAGHTNTSSTTPEPVEPIEAVSDGEPNNQDIYFCPPTPIEQESRGLGRVCRPGGNGRPTFPRAGIRRRWGVSRSGCAFRPGRPDQPERLRETARSGIAVARQDPACRQAVKGIQ